MPGTLQIKLLLNILSSILSNGSSALVRVVSVPLFLGFWGAERYGEWLVLSSIPIWLSMSDLGIGSVVANEMSVRASQGDIKGASQALRTAGILIISIALFIGILSGVIAFSIPWEQLLGLKTLRSQEAAYVVTFLITMTMIGFHSAVIGGIFRAGQRAAAGIFWATLSQWINLAVIVVVVVSGRGFVELALALLVAKLLFLLIYAALAHSACPDIRFCDGRFNRSDAKLFIKKGFAFCAFPLGNALLFEGAVFIVNFFLGSIAVALFGTARTLTRAANQFMQLINSATWPEFSHLLGSRDFDRAKRLHRLSLIVSVLGASAIVAIILIFGPGIYKLWTANRLALSTGQLAIFCLPVITNAIWFTSSVVHAASNKHEGLAIRFLLGAALTMLGSFMLTPRYGIEGAAISLIILDCVLIPYVLNKSFKLTRDSRRAFVRGAVQEFVSLPRLALRSVNGLRSPL